MVTADDRRLCCEVCSEPDAGLLQLDSPAGSLRIRLCADHAEKLGRQIQGQLIRMCALQSDLTHGRRLRDGEASDVIRQWARARGLPVSAVGSIAPKILAAYREEIALRNA